MAGGQGRPSTPARSAAHPGDGAHVVPRREAAVLGALILVATVANLNLAVANVALPDIGRAFDASQTQLDMVAVGYSLGLAGSVLYFGALGDRYGRKMMLILGMALSVPASVLAAEAPSTVVLTLARVLGGISAGMAYPTTLALITALWSGPPRTRAIALWSGIGGATAALGPLAAGWMLLHFYWGSVFLITLPLAAAALVLAALLVPSHVHETTEPVDNLGGVLSIVMVGAVVVAINFAAEPGKGTTAAVLGAVGMASLAAFWARERRTRAPLYDLHLAGRRIFWVAGTAGVIVFGSLMGTMFVGQQFVQNVLGYSPLEAGLSILPAVAGLVVMAPLSARLVTRHGSRTTLLAGFGTCLAGALVMLVLWTDAAAFWRVGLGYLLIGAGVGLAGTPASNSLTGAVPVRRAGMASGTADLQRDLGGAVMQSILGALLTAGYASAFGKQIASANAARTHVSATVQSELQKSFSSAEGIAHQFPQYASQITAAAKASFLSGADWAYGVAMLAIAAGAALVLVLYPGRDRERELLDGYRAEDEAAARSAPDPAGAGRAGS